MTDYDTEIFRLQKEFDSLTAQANVIEKGEEDSTDIQTKRGIVYEELIRLNRLKFEEINEKTGYDNDY
jgi:hypothetical protein